MNVWEHLFMIGEFAPRAHILGGLTLEQVGTRPGSAPHSIYEELWHVTKWQTFVLRMARGEAVRSDYKEEEFPDAQAPETEDAWKALVTEFLTGSEEAVALAGDTKALVRLSDGLTVRERLELLAVHNAYHLAKIVLLRQLLGSWSPPPEDARAQ